MRDFHNLFSIRRRALLKTLGLGTLVGNVGGRDAVGGVFGRMYAVPPQDPTNVTPNSNLTVVNYTDASVSASCDLNVDQRTLHIKGSA